MLTDEKIKEVRKMLRSGVPEGELKSQLLTQGYTEEDINRIFAPHKYDMRGWLLCFAIIILLGGVYSLITNGSRPLIWIAFAAFLFFEYYQLNQKFKQDADKPK